MGFARRADSSTLDTATVTITNLDTDDTRTTATDGGGFYGGVDLAPGPYLVKAELGADVLYTCTANVSAGSVTTADAAPETTAPASDRRARARDAERTQRLVHDRRDRHARRDGRLLRRRRHRILDLTAARRGLPTPAPSSSTPRAPPTSSSARPTAPATSRLRRRSSSSSTRPRPRSHSRPTRPSSGRPTARPSTSRSTATGPTPSPASPPSPTS